MPIEGPSAGHGLDKACKAAARVVALWPKSWVRSLQNFAQVAGEKPRVRVAHDHVSRHRRILQPAQPMEGWLADQIGSVLEIGLRGFDKLTDQPFQRGTVTLYGSGNPWPVRLKVPFASGYPGTPSPLRRAKLHIEEPCRAHTSCEP